MGKFKDFEDDDYSKGKKKNKHRREKQEWYPYEPPIIDVESTRSENVLNENSDDSDI